MALIISASASVSSTSTSARSASFSLSSPSSSLIPFHKTTRISLATWIPQLGLRSFWRWSGLKRLGLSITPRGLKTIERRGRCKGKAVQASLFGVGAPEALVIGVVALLVFGPKGLAEVARNLGKTLRAFQPTLRELQEVSREFKNTLEREIGLNEISSQKQNTYSSNTASTTSNTSSVSTKNSPPAADPNGSPSPNRAYTSEEYLKITEEQLQASAGQQDETSPPETTFEPKIKPQATVEQTANAMLEQTANAIPPPQKPENQA